MNINHFSYISTNAEVYIGDNCNINGLKVLGKGKVTIGDNFHCGEGLLIMLGSHEYDNDDYIPYGEKLTSKEVVICDNVWLGRDVTVSGNVKIGEGAIAATRAVIVKDVPPCAIVGGNPAKIIKFRNKEHYYHLKELKKFH